MTLTLVFLFSIPPCGHNVTSIETLALLWYRIERQGALHVADVRARPLLAGV